MRADCKVIKTLIASHPTHIMLALLVLLTSCAYPNGFLPVSTEPINSIERSTIQPSSSMVPADNLSTDSAPLQPYLTSSPQITVDEPTPVQPPPYQVPALYNLEATFDYHQHSLSVAETIGYVNYSADYLVDLVLIVEPNRWQGGFVLVSMVWEEGEIIDAYQLKDDQMHIPLHQPLPPGGRLGLKINYQLQIPAIPVPTGFDRPVPYGYTEQQTNIVDWYPYIPPYFHGKGWLVHPHWWFGEHQVFDVADFQVKITLAEPVEDLVIAASAPAGQDGDTYLYHLEAARTFALSASTEYLVQSTTVGGVTINSYSLPYDKNAGYEVLNNTADALQLYSDLIMPYPHTSLSVVEADFLDGMEYDGLYFLSHGFYNLYDGTPKGYLTFIAAHETAHQWWYGLVANDQAIEPWLDEALCTYMERVFYENIYPDYPSDSNQSLVDWWWFYRVDFYDPTGWVDGTIYDFSGFRAYRDAIYLNGAKFLEDLRNLIGDEAFFAFLKDYAIQNAHGIATSADFFSILKSHTSQNLDGLMANYFQASK